MLSAAAGAQATSFDNSPNSSQKTVWWPSAIANIHCEQGDMADLSRFEDESFDLIFHPVSNVFPSIFCQFGNTVRGCCGLADACSAVS